MHVRDEIQDMKWEAVEDKGTSKTYYFNPITNETHWDLPSPSVHETSSTEDHTHAEGFMEWF